MASVWGTKPTKRSRVALLELQQRYIESEREKAALLAEIRDLEKGKEKEKEKEKDREKGKAKAKERAKGAKARPKPKPTLKAPAPAPEPVTKETTAEEDPRPLLRSFRSQVREAPSVEEH